VHIRFFQKLHRPRNEPASQIFHGKHRHFDYRVIGSLIAGGWYMRVQILSNGRRIRKYRDDTRAYPDFESLRIAGVIIAHEMMARLDA
jgi:hypothetical protein